MKILQKLLMIVIIGIFTIGIMPNTSSFAADGSVYDAMDEISAAGTDSTMVSNLNDVISKLLGFLQIASGLMAIIMIAWTGFRYIIETPDMKAELKKTMIPIIVGALLVFGAVTIAKFIIGLVGQK